MIEYTLASRKVLKLAYLGMIKDEEKIKRCLEKALRRTFFLILIKKPKIEDSIKDGSLQAGAKRILEHAYNLRWISESGIAESAL